MSARIIESLGRAWESEGGWGNVEFTVDLNRSKWTTDGRMLDGLSEAISSHLNSTSLMGWGVQFSIPPHGCGDPGSCFWSRIGGFGSVHKGILKLDQKTVKCRRCGKPLQAVPTQKNQFMVVLAAGTLDAVLGGRCAVQSSVGTAMKDVGGLVWDNEGKSVVGLYLGERPPVKQISRAVIESVVRGARVTREEAIKRVDILTKEWLCNDLMCTGPRGHSLCRMKWHFGVPEVFIRIIETLHIEVDLFADVFHRCEATSIKKWFSDSGEWGWAGSEGTCMETRWNEMRALIFPPNDGKVHGLVDVLSGSWRPPGEDGEDDEQETINYHPPPQ